MTELEKCRNGEVFTTADPEIGRIIQSAWTLLRRYNDTEAGDGGERTRLSGKLLGKIGNNVHVDRPFSCDYGLHIRLGGSSLHFTAQHPPGRAHECELRGGGAAVVPDLRPADHYWGRGLARGRQRRGPVFTGGLGGGGQSVSGEQKHTALKADSPI